ncbi:hypothetical protein M0804_007656 [Polistes exclamans]|nr:hypothetical protein M0804_007656 [Polistes exclamans]
MAVRTVKGVVVLVVVVSSLVGRRESVEGTSWNELSHLTSATTTTTTTNTTTTTTTTTMTTTTTTTFNSVHQFYISITSTRTGH